MLRVTIFVCSLVITSYGRVLETEFSPRIINGKDAQLGEIPYQVSLQYRILQIHTCGGSIYNENYIITAAHCVEKVNAKNIQVVGGIVDLLDNKSVHLVSKIIIHNGYNPGDSYIHDIALIKVASPFKFSKTVRPVALPKSNSKVSVNKNAVVSGWGYTRVVMSLSGGTGRRHKKLLCFSPSFFPSAHNTGQQDRHKDLTLQVNGVLSRFLQKVTVLIADHNYCRKVYASLKNNIYETHICAHDPVQEHGSCQGDSGGPLTVDGVLVGIVSWANKCALVDYPTVFTRVPKYIDWIHEHAI